MYRSLSTIKADLARTEFGFTGKNVVWAIVSTGVDGRHPHFAKYRNTELPSPLRHFDYATLYSDLSKSGRPWAALDDRLLEERYALDHPVDVNGLGTAIAGVIAGEGEDDNSKQSIRGIAPETSILSMQVFDAEGRGS